MASPRERRWALVRILLGWAQMFGAAFSFVLLITTGVSQASSIAVVVTAVLTTISVLLFGAKNASKNRRP
jgi:hypothetical protein